MSVMTEEMWETARAIQGNLSHARRSSAATKHLKYVDGKPTWEEDRNPVIRRSMFPFYSNSMAVDPAEVPEVQERLRKEGVLVEFDREGRPEITSTKQHARLATALGMKTGRDGYGHTDEMGRFHNSGRRRTEEMQQGRGRVRRAIDKLESMPETVPAHFVEDVLNEYDIHPNEENTG